MKIWAGLVKSRHLMLGCVLTLICFCSVIWAQNDRGTLTGRVSDTTGAVVSKATVQATETSSGVKYSASTTDTGYFAIVSLPAGSYNLTVTASGFKKYLQNGITIHVAQTATLDVQLQVGAATENVTVTAADAPLLTTEDAEQNTTISRETLNNLPINFSANQAIRDATAFFKLSAGSTDLGYIGGVRINGLPSSSFKVMVDGQDATGPNVADQDLTAIRPSVDAMQEFTLESSNFNAENGQVSGGLFNFTARSGTNQLHGSAYDNFANEDLNSGQPFNLLSNGQRYQALDKQNDYGFTVGGPVWLPKVYNGHNKTFFFFSYEAYRKSGSNLLTFTVPTDQMRAGDFSQILTGNNLGTDVLGRPIMENTIYDPTTRRIDPVSSQVVTDPFPGNKISAGLSSAATSIAKLMPEPNIQNTLVNNYSTSVASPSTQDIISFKIDHALSDKWKTSFYWSYFGSKVYYTNDGLPNPITSNRLGTPHSYTWRANTDYTITPSLYLHAGAGWMSETNHDSGVNTGYDASQIGMPKVSTTGFPIIQFGTSPYGGGFNNTNDPNNEIGTYATNLYEPGKFTSVVSLTWIRGNHTVKTGANFNDDRWVMNQLSDTSGEYTISANETALPYLGSTKVGGGNIGYNFASFMLGLADSGLASSPTVANYRRPYTAVYAQDTWKITPKFTLDYGIRWELSNTIHDSQYRTSAFATSNANPNAGGLAGAMEYEGFGPGRCNCNLMKTYPFAYAPRLGVTYQITPKTVFRAGWGVVYGSATTMDYMGANVKSVGVGFNTLTFGAPGFGLAAGTLGSGFNFTQAQLNAASLDPGIGVTAGSISSAPSPWYDPSGARPSRINSWSVGVQRELTQNMMLEAAYVGNRGMWETSGDNGHLALVQLNALSLAKIRAAGFDPTSAADRAVLTSTFDTGIPQAHGFQIPYAGFPTSGSLVQSLRPYPQFDMISSQFAPVGKSWYDSLQVKLTNRLSHGLEMLTAFTWARQYEMGQNYRGRYAPINNDSDWAGNKFLSQNDQPYVLSVAFTYDIPIFKAMASNWLSKDVFGGWQLGGIERASSGFPISIPWSNNALESLTFENEGTSTATFANRVSGQKLFQTDPNSHFNPSNTQIFNPNAWADAAPGTYGVSAIYESDFRWTRNYDEEASLGKTFNLGERAKLNIRGEFFNVFNRATLPSWVVSETLGIAPTDANGYNPNGFGNIGYPSSNNAPRTGQLMGRVTF